MTFSNFMRSVLGAVAGIGLLTAVGTSSAYAADPAEPVEPVAEKWRWAFTPRLWYLFETDHYFQDDVFFHFQDWDGTVTQDGSSNHQLAPEVEMWVEFELDDEHFATEKRLRAKVVRPTDRPVGRKLSGRDATFKIVTHHPNARKERPTWRH